MDEQLEQTNEDGYAESDVTDPDGQQRALIEELGIIKESGAHPNRHTQKPSPLSAYDIDVVQDDEKQKYEAILNDHAVGQLVYKYVSGGKRVALLGTSISEAYRHRGVASEFIARVLDDIRLSGRTVTVICPVIRAFIDKFPEYEDLVDRAHPGVASIAPAPAHSQKER